MDDECKPLDCGVFMLKYADYIAMVRWCTLIPVLKGNWSQRKRKYACQKMMLCPTNKCPWAQI